MNPFLLNHKNVLVTGASSGIGINVAIECSKMRAILLISARDKGQLEQTLSKLSGTGHVAITADLTNETEINDMVERLSVLDGAVHVAGVAKPKPFQFLNRNELDAVMHINFYEPISQSNLLGRKKRLNKNGSIVFISSISSNAVSFIAGSAYSGSKVAINGFVKGMALDLAEKNQGEHNLVQDDRYGYF